MFVSALPDPTCNSEKSANGGNKQILLLLLLLLLLKEWSQFQVVMFPKSTSGLGYEANPFFVGVWVCFSGTN